jgi:hypothetical protein
MTESRGQVVNTPTAYSGGPIFDSRFRWLAILVDVYVISLSSSRLIPGEYLIITPQRIPIKCFQIHHNFTYHPIIDAVKSSYWKVVVK